MARASIALWSSTAACASTAPSSSADRGLYRGRYVYRGGPWVRPRNYWWPLGGAVAAGAALGMVAASSAAWAGPAPGPGYCWYYTDPSQRQGFWDQCP